jgi:hypothetical protein
MSYFGFKSQIFLNNFEWGIKYFKLKGRKKGLEGHMRPAGCTLAMSALDNVSFVALTHQLQPWFFCLANL